MKAAHFTAGMRRNKGQGVESAAKIKPQMIFNLSQPTFLTLTTMVAGVQVNLIDSQKIIVVYQSC